MNSIIRNSLVILSALILFIILGGKTAFADVTTGNATSDQTVTNVIDTHYDCNCTPTPTQTQATPTPTPTQSTPTPTPGNNGGGGSGGGDGSSDGLSSCPSCTQGPQGPTQAVLGLSTTNSGNNIYVELMQAITALVLATAGYKFFKKNA